MGKMGKSMLNTKSFSQISFHGATDPSGRGSPNYQEFEITLSHKTLCMTPPDKRSAR